MHSQRFDRPVSVTRHARERMTQRVISEDELSALLEHGDLRYKDDMRLWATRHFEGRRDNLICAALVIEDHVVVKTVMHHFAWSE